MNINTYSYIICEALHCYRRVCTAKGAQNWVKLFTAIRVKQRLRPAFRVPDSTLDAGITFIIVIYVIDHMIKKRGEEQILNDSDVHIFTMIQFFSKRDLYHK